MHIKLFVIIGTRAQLIKMAPVIREIEKRDIVFDLIFTNQHEETMQDLLHSFKIKIKPINLFPNRLKEAKSVLSIAGWFPSTCVRLKAYLKRQIHAATVNIALVHGDTLSTLAGALVGKLSGAQVAHIESGLRSFNLWNPFPEEIIRLLVFRLSDIAFCPDEWSANNLKKYNIKTVNTGHNTIIDALAFAVESQERNHQFVTSERMPYCVLSLHRFENIYNDNRLNKIIEIIKHLSGRITSKFVLHPSTRSRLISKGSLESLRQLPDVDLVSRMSYEKFIALLSKASFVITDGGSNQEELSYLGIPTLLLRSHTERKEGLNKNVCLSSFDDGLIYKFIAHNLKLKPTASSLGQFESPSGIIVDYLMNKQDAQ